MPAEQRAELILGGVVLFLAALFLVWGFGGRFQPRGGYELIASFPDAGGIEPGTDVRLAGVLVGRVTRVQLNPQTYFADAAIEIPNHIMLPVDSAALIQSDGLIGGSYVELQPGGSPDNLAPGDEIEDVQGKVSLISLMMKFVDSQSSNGDGQ